MKNCILILLLVVSGALLTAQCPCKPFCTGAKDQSGAQTQQIVLTITDDKGQIQNPVYEVFGDIIVEKSKFAALPVSTPGNNSFIGQMNEKGEIKYGSVWRTWENGYVPYEIAGNASPFLKDVIELSVKFLNQKTNICLSPRNGEPDYIIFIPTIENGGFSEGVGKKGGSQFIKFGQKTDRDRLVSTIVHEILHAIGLFHEHQLPNRDTYLNIKWSNICPDYQYAFYKLNAWPPGYPRGYSYQSIMHYAPCGFSINNDCVMECKDYKTGAIVDCPESIGQRKSLTGKDIQVINTLYPQKNDCKKQTTLFLVDVSGSMSENNKIYQARDAAINKVRQLGQEAQLKGQSPEVGIMVFSGDCIANPTRMIQPFTTDLVEAEMNIQKISFPNGGTPLVQAIEQAEKTLDIQLKNNRQGCGTIIILSDGQSSCGPIRPPSTYVGVHTINTPCNTTVNSLNKSNITYNTIGFDIQSGSAAERDLQYLAFSSGGKYFNAQDQYQLNRSFQRINRVYSPINDPQTIELDSAFADLFFIGTVFASVGQYDTALVHYKKFIQSYPADSSGLYNYALMCEANERYKSAVRYYEMYLQLAPNDPNRAFLLERIATLRKDYEIFLTYNKQIIQSDLAYLNRHFEQLRHTPDAVPLAGEFAGFIREKQTFYRALPDILEMEEPWLKQYAKEIAQALKEATYFLSKNPKQWDLDGISMIGNVYEPLDRLAKKLGL